MAGMMRPKSEPKVRSTWDDMGADGQGQEISRSPSGEFIYYPGQPFGYLDGKPIPTPTTPGSHFIPLPPGTTVTNILGGRSTTIVPKNAKMPQGGIGGQSKSLQRGGVYDILNVPQIGQGVQGGVNRQAIDLVAPDGTIIQIGPEFRKPYPEELKVWKNKK